MGLGCESVVEVTPQPVDRVENASTPLLVSDPDPSPIPRARCAWVWLAVPELGVGIHVLGRGARYARSKAARSHHPGKGPLWSW
jgi:hypothetical protein